MPWFDKQALGGCSFCGGLSGDALSVNAAWAMLQNRGHAVRSQYELYTQNRARAAAVQEALDELDEALTQARGTLQTGHGTATIDQWAGLQDTYRTTEYTFRETTRLLALGPPSTGGGGGSGSGGGGGGTPGGKTPPGGNGGGFDLSSITSSPAFLPVVLGVGAVGVVLLLTGNKGK